MLESKKFFKPLQTKLIVKIMANLTVRSLKIITDPVPSSTLEHKLVSNGVIFAISDQGLTTTVWLHSSIETPAIFSDFVHFEAGSTKFELVMVKRCVWGPF